MTSEAAATEVGKLEAECVQLVDKKYAHIDYEDFHQNIEACASLYTKISDEAASKRGKKKTTRWSWKVLERDCGGAPKNGARKSGARKRGPKKRGAPKSRTRKRGAPKRGAGKDDTPKRPKAEPKCGPRVSGFAGCSWDRFRGRWIVDWKVEKKKKRKYIRPNDQSDEQVELARQKAVELLHQVRGLGHTADQVPL